MGIINEQFKEIETGETLKIVEIQDNIAITDSRERIDVNRLTDKNYYYQVPSGPRNLSDDVIDPASFFKKTAIADLIPEIQSSMDNMSSRSVEDSNLIHNEQSSIVTESSDEDERAELARKYNIPQPPPQPKKSIQDFLSEEEFPQSNKNQIVPHNQPQVQMEDPIMSIFKGIKRSVDFKMGFEIDGKLPRLDFIEMMEDSYDKSIIEYLADEFTNNLLQDPSILKRKITEEIKKMVGIDAPIRKSIPRKSAPRKRAPKKK